MAPTRPNIATSAFSRADLDATFDLDDHALLWWRSSGHALAVLLDKAGYSDDAQFRLLKFIRAVTPSLGRFPISGKQKWRSFMTDDHTPIELSWDWGTAGKPPKIRFSIEPVGPHAGTSLDPDNKSAAYGFLEMMMQLLPATHMDWLNHFRQRLCGAKVRGSIEGHATKEFYAFDLGEEDIVSKAYFFPGYEAQRTSQTNMDVILQTIRSAPGSTPEIAQALNTFQDYAQDPATPPLEMDMLATDLVNTAESRFKIYFRVRASNFTSMQDTMTLGNRLNHPGMKPALDDLREFYHASRRQGCYIPSDDVNIIGNDHRTGGMLYYIELKSGSPIPKVKVYIPVRHYAESEEAIINALNQHLRHIQSPNSKMVASYKDAMQAIFT
ncbi:unnamed protein product [Clonostachys rosea]|uniref:Tryptophan dimethylallyltransferase n=1 Tax=Bionectria ochroleuca TaxID=29856 RepID=A0ABY6U8Q2_BIOOC|nr:unnamed protein product [Clonostachys rosea]